MVVLSRYVLASLTGGVGCPVVCTLRWVGAFAVTALGLIFLAPAPSFADLEELLEVRGRCIQDSVSLLQSDLMGSASGNDLGDVLLSGNQFFVCPMVPAEGQGEGESGPRAVQRTDTWPAGQASIPFLRFNGLGSQRCWECHNSAGVAFEFIPNDDKNPPGPWFDIKQGGTGGAGGYASTLYQNPEWPYPDREGKLINIVRSPPAVFGSGYLQRLAYEMTVELQAIEERTIERARQSVEGRAEAPLLAKGVSFGTLVINCENASCSQYAKTGYEGIQADLIVRPLQHKGVASTVRHFVMSALDFHLGMQAVELVGPNNDCDDDGKYNEMAADVSFQAAGSFEDLVKTEAVQQSIGNVTALTAWTGMVRPPQFQASLPIAEEGRSVFVDVGCDDCHRTNLTLETPIFTIQNPPIPKTCPPTSGLPSLGSNTVRPSDLHPFVAEKLVAAGDLDCPEGFYCIDLSNDPADPALASAPTDTQFPTIFTTFLPRLPERPDQKVDVALYSDLKRHRMGSHLAQIGPEQDDDSGNPIPNDEWLTSKLWGVADTGPWLHDGRARTLNEAILQHEGPGSEANQAVANYKSLAPDDRKALIAFLDSLRLPADPPAITLNPILNNDDDITDLNATVMISSRRLMLVNYAGADGRNLRQIRFSSNDSVIEAPASGSDGDPTQYGARLSVYNADGANEEVTVNLPADKWSVTASGFRYAGGRDSEVQSVSIGSGRIQISSRSAAWSYPLEIHEQGAVAVRLTLGQEEWCASALARTSGTPPSTERYDRPGFFQGAPRSPALTTCPVPPSNFRKHVGARAR